MCTVYGYTVITYCQYVIGIGIILMLLKYLYLLEQSKVIVIVDKSNNNDLFNCT